MAVVRPAGAVVTDRRVEPHRVQHALDVVGIVALLEQCEGGAPGVAARGRERRFGELCLGPFRVRDLEVAREAPEVATVHRWDVATDGDVAVAVVTREVELREPLERAHDRRAVAVALAEAEGRARFGDGELEAVGLTVEAVGQVAEEEQRGRTERRQPERLDVARAGVVPERVDQGVGPGLDGQGGGHCTPL